jgi:hypothetical protein
MRRESIRFRNDEASRRSFPFRAAEPGEKWSRARSCDGGECRPLIVRLAGTVVSSALAGSRPLMSSHYRRCVSGCAGLLTFKTR